MVHHVVRNVSVKYSRSVAMSCPPNEHMYMYSAIRVCTYVIHWEVAAWGNQGAYVHRLVWKVCVALLTQLPDDFVEFPSLEL